MFSSEDDLMYDSFVEFTLRIAIDMNDSRNFTLLLLMFVRLSANVFAGHAPFVCCNFCFVSVRHVVSMSNIYSRLFPFDLKFEHV